MTFVLTFVASSAKHPLKDSHIKSAAKIAAVYNVQSKSKPLWLAKHKAADLDVSGEGGSSMLMQIREMLAPDQIDLFITPHANRRKKLLLADMDSTIVAGETLDDMAEFAGIKDQIAAITARAMNGELDFHAALKERVGLLKGLSTESMQKTLLHTVINPGAQTFIATMQNHGATCVLVSGGFTFFTSAIAGQLGFDHNHGNTLGITEGINGEQLSGEVIPPILDKFAKVEFLEHYTMTLGLGPEDALTIGDGANDLPMLKKAGLGIGYYAKPNVASELKNLIIYGDLSAALYAQGFKADDFCLSV
jgi:phosphoserine phosphatase